MTKTRPLSYKLFQTRENGQPRTLARVTCSRCPAILDVPITGTANHLVIVGRHAHSAGWLFNKNTARKCVCPSCYLGTITDYLAGVTDADQHEEPASAPPIPMVDMIESAERQSSEISETSLGAALVAATKEKKMTQEPKTGPTPEHKLKIRAFLDGNYDERRKGYLEGYTDKRAGDELGVPWAWVRDLREVAYGPIECDPDLEEVRKEIDTMRAAIAKMEGRLSRMEAARR